MPSRSVVLLEESGEEGERAGLELLSVVSAELIEVVVVGGGSPTGSQVEQGVLSARERVLRMTAELPWVQPAEKRRSTGPRSSPSSARAAAMTAC